MTLLVFDFQAPAAALLAVSVQRKEKESCNQFFPRDDFSPDGGARQGSSLISFEFHVGPRLKTGSDLLPLEGVGKSKLNRPVTRKPETGRAGPQ